MLDSTLTVDEPSAPRRVAIATLFQDVLRTERDLEALYDDFARRVEIPYLRGAFRELAQAKRERVAALDGLARALGGSGEGGAAVPEPGPPPAPVERRSDVFARAFVGERALEAAYRELLALVGDPARCPGLAELAAGSARHRALLRDVYLRYS